MLFDIDHVPFSRKGRFLTLSTMRVAGRDGERALYLRRVSGGDERPSLGRLCRVEFLDGEGRPAATRFQLSPDQLVARTGEGIVRFVIGDGERLHIRGENAGVRFHVEGSRYDYVYRTPGGEWCLVAAGENMKFIPRGRLGELAVSGKWDRDRSTDVSFTLSGEGTFEGNVDFFRALPPPEGPGSFEEAHAAVTAEFGAWYRSMPAGVPGQEEAQRLAAYLLWANTVPAEGVLTRPAIYMSKKRHDQHLELGQCLLGTRRCRLRRRACLRPVRSDLRPSGRFRPAAGLRERPRSALRLHQAPPPFTAGPSPAWRAKIPPS
ncbi:hypothetical protein Q1M63_12850 (plasmid) [Sinorhizobium meliloti]|nr:hypothetical protein Q1M63_12850 [Sinorhizobium meliloti]